MTKTQTAQKRPRPSPLLKRRNKVTPGREDGRKLITSRTRAVKLRDIAKEMKQATVVADRIVAVATEQKPASPAKQKRPAVRSKALPRGSQA